MAGMVFFTDNYADRSSDDGYQFEFYCRRCGNGYSSPFQHSVTGFGGRLLRLGGDVIGGQLGEQASKLGWDAECHARHRARLDPRQGAGQGRRADEALLQAVPQLRPVGLRPGLLEHRARPVRDLRAQAGPGDGADAGRRRRSSS